MSSYTEADCSPVLESRELSEYGNDATVEAGDVKGCIEKLIQLGTVRVSIFEEEEAREWFKRLQSVWKVTWRVTKTVPGRQRNIFKTQYKCQHNLRGTDALTRKNTNCPARFLLTLKRTKLVKGAAKSTSKDPLMNSHPLIATLQGEHNHPIDAAAALKYRDVSDEAQQQLKDLFAAGHSPSSAYDLLRYRIMSSDPERYVFNAADRHNLPELKYCYRLYYKARRQECSAPTGDVLLAAAKAGTAASNGTMACRTTEAAGTAEAPSCSQVPVVSRRCEASPAQHAPDEGLHASEPTLTPVCSDFEQSSDGASQENTDERQQVLRRLHAFIEEQAATAEGFKCLAAMDKAITRLGRGPALQSSMLAFGQKTVPSLRAIKSSTTIGVQPTAAARRKMPLGGRKRIHAGRPVSAAKSADKLLHLAKRRKVPAPHSLSQCVKSIMSLGKSH